MPVGAIIGAGVATAGATVVAGSKNASAINKSTEAQTAGNAQSLAMQERVYGENKATLAPFVGTGVAASNQINALLGLSTPQPQQPTQGALGAFQTPTNALTGMGGALSGPNFAGYVQNNPDVQNEFQRVGARFGNDASAFGQFHWQNYGQNEGRALPQFGQASPASPAPGATPQSALAAFDQYRNSTGYQFRLREGMNALNSGYAGRGVLQSGAAIKGALDYGQNIASGEFGNYLNSLQTQQNVGAGAASAQAGVGQNFAGNVTNLNTANANALASGAVASANNTNGIIGGLTNALNTGIGAGVGVGAFGRPGMPTASQLNTSALSSLRGY